MTAAGDILTMIFPTVLTSMVIIMATITIHFMLLILFTTPVHMFHPILKQAHHEWLTWAVTEADIQIQIRVLLIRNMALLQ